MSKPTMAMRATFAQIDREWPEPSLERLTAKIAFTDAMAGLPADDLRAMGIDRAEVRWAAARGYLKQERENATFALNRTLILIFAAGMASQSATARGADKWVGRLDVLDAVPRIKRPFGPRAAQIVAETLMPSSIRDEA